MKKRNSISRSILALAAACGAVLPAKTSQAQETLRLPAIPLVTNDPYLSIWSEADHLTDDVTRHWTHREQPIVSLIRIDGKTSRLMGLHPKEIPAFPQVSMRVLPTQSIYEFDDGHVHVTLKFLTPALPGDLEILARPVTYLIWQVRSVDGGSHQVSIYDSVSSQLAVNSPDQEVEWSRQTMGVLTALRTGTTEQPLLQRAGDDVRIDWGYAYAAALSSETKSAMGENAKLESQFNKTGAVNSAEDTEKPRPANEHQPVLAFSFDLGNVGSASVDRHLIFAYDEVYAISLFGKKLRPYWRRNGATPTDLLQSAEKDYASLVVKCEKFDQDLMTDLTKAGGARYAQIAAGAYRQALAGNGLAADTNGQPLLFTKENSSDGDIATVDVIFPMEPIFLFFSPTLAKASLVPILNYAASPHWKFPNAPHDLGAYPRAYGTDDGGEGMPVEESGNMLILCDALAQIDGNANFVKPWWPQLKQWGEYLEKYGLDPEEQLCTDDFMGHLAHNSNLSVKAILGLAAYGDLCRMRGDISEANKYAAIAKADAQHWVHAASDGNHSRLAFDKPGTWSQKYNLVWDRILGLNVFPPEVAQQEIAYYKTMMQQYGLPLDSRTHLTKTDWTTWCATMADNQADFEQIMSPTYDYLNTTTTHLPLVDSYKTDDIHSDGMRARPVVGGIFIKMLADKTVWEKWASQDKTKLGIWAKQPDSEKLTEVVPTSQVHPQIWRYTTSAPSADWTKPDFDDSAWKSGPGGFSTRGTPGVVHGTTWNTDDIWIRRQVTIPSSGMHDPRIVAFHDEDIEVYFNGIVAAREGGFITAYQPMDVSTKAEQLLKPGAQIVIAAHCHQTTGGQGIDIGLADAVKP